MAIDIQEIYATAIRPLPDKEKLQLATLILEEVTRKGEDEKPRREGDITKFFGMWKGDDENGSDNEQIDRDLARAYAQEYEDKE
ncbi:MAG: hypothetical protein WKF84_23905 [Pyrinomonadaceae bacterium]